MEHPVGGFVYYEDVIAYRLGTVVTGSSSNGSNNTNKETRSNSSADRSASGRFTGGDTDDTVTVRPAGRRSTTSTDDPAVTASAAAADVASPGGSGSLDDEWSQQMDELDRLRPVVAFDDERLVVDSFTDLPDIVIYDEDEDVHDDTTSVKHTAGEQVTSFVMSLSLCFEVILSHLR